MREKSLLIPFTVILIFFSMCSSQALFSQRRSGGGQTSNGHLLQSPIRLTAITGGDILVSDYQAAMIFIMKKKTMRIYRRFSIEGRPLGIAYAKGRIYVGNEKTSRIEVYNRSGRQFRGINFSEPVGKPTDIAIDEGKNSLFTVDGTGQSVKVFTLRGKMLRSFPTANSEDPILANPTGIALDTGSREVYVSDYGDPLKSIEPRIQIFDYSGNLLGTISSKGTGMLAQPKFSRPQGIAVDDNSHLFLVDCYAGEILVLDRFTGNLLNTIGSFGTGEGELQLPLDIVINSSSKDLYITNNRAARVEIFPKGGQL